MKEMKNNGLRTYAIRRAFVFPLGLAILLAVALLGISLYQGQPFAKAVILGFMILPLLALFVESSWRRVVVDGKGVRALRPFREKKMLFTEVTRLDVVQVRSRVFLTLSAENDDFLIISNSYAHFSDLIKDLIQAVPEGIVSEEALQLAACPKQRQADVFTAWFAVCALVYVLIAQFV